MNDYRPRYFTVMHGSPRSFVVKDFVDCGRFLVAHMSGVLMSRSQTKSMMQA